MKTITVTAAILKRGDKYFIAKRKEGKHLAGMWEFPGGKLENNETREECLDRELYEEFGIKTNVRDLVSESTHEYDGIIVHLIAYNVEYISGEFKPIDHDEIAWVSRDEMNSYNFAPADLPIIEALPSM